MQSTYTFISVSPRFSNMNVWNLSSTAFVTGLTCIFKAESLKSNVLVWEVSKIFEANYFTGKYKKKLISYMNKDNLRAPVDSILLAVFTVSPKRQYLGILTPTTPAQQGPR